MYYHDIRQTEAGTVWWDPEAQEAKGKDPHHGSAGAIWSYDGYALYHKNMNASSRDNVNRVSWTPDRFKLIANIIKLYQIKS